jgi:FkbH-like protein
MIAEAEIQKKKKDKQTIKVVVWDLDNTVWDGILLEDTEVVLRPHVVEILKTLDERGILHSVASRNDHDLAMAKLQEFGIEEYFLYPQINWSPKSGSVAQIAKDINIGLDAVAFVDDQPFEREEVAFTHEKVLCIDSAELDDLLDRSEFNPRFITEDSRLRRQMYMADIRRNQEEEKYVGATEEFLSTLGMVFTVHPTRAEDLKRAEELTVRTNQLNTTGYTYSYEELDELSKSPRHKLLVSQLEDKHGSYGKIGLTLIETDPEVWTIKLLLMSCRVMSKGVGMVMIHYLARQAKEAGVKLRAEFVSTDRNRQMLITYKFAGFKEVARNGDVMIMENDYSAIQPTPPYVKLIVEE